MRGKKRGGGSSNFYLSTDRRKNGVCSFVIAGFRLRLLTWRPEILFMALWTHALVSNTLEVFLKIRLVYMY